MEVLYRKLFLKDLKKLKGSQIYERIEKLVFKDLPNAKELSDIPNLKSLKNSVNGFRIRIGDYRIGIKLANSTVEVMRVKHRKEFYKFYP